MVCWDYFKSGRLENYRWDKYVLGDIVYVFVRNYMLFGVVEF